MSALGLLRGPFPTFPGSPEFGVQLHIPLCFPLPQKASPFPPNTPHPLKHQLKLQERQRLEHPLASGTKQAGCKLLLPAPQDQAPLEKSPRSLCSEQPPPATTAFKGNQGTEKSSGLL